MSPRQREFEQLFRQVSVLFSRYYAQLLNQQDLTLPQYSLMATLGHEGPLPMHTLAEKLHISRSAVTQIVDRLVEKKMIKRLSDTEDRRVKQLSLIQKGDRVVDLVQTQSLRFCTQLVSEFSEKEQLVIRNFYKLLIQRLNEGMS